MNTNKLFGAHDKARRALLTIPGVPTSPDIPVGSLGWADMPPAYRQEPRPRPFARPTGYNLGKSGWVTASFKAGEYPPYDVLQSWIDESYQAIAPKRVLAALKSEKKPKK